MEKICKSNEFYFKIYLRLIENQLQGIGVVFFNSPSMIKGLKPELIHLMLQLAAITSPNLQEINFMLASLLTSLEDYDKSIKVYKEIYEDKISYFDDEVSLRINLENFLQIENYKRTVSENTIFKKFTWEKTCSNMLLVYKNI